MCMPTSKIQKLFPDLGGPQRTTRLEQKLREARLVGERPLKFCQRARPGHQLPWDARSPLIRLTRSMRSLTSVQRSRETRLRSSSFRLGTTTSNRPVGLPAHRPMIGINLEAWGSRPPLTDISLTNSAEFPETPKILV